MVGVAAIGDAWLYGTPRWVLAQTWQEACDRLETTVMRPSVCSNRKLWSQDLPRILRIGVELDLSQIRDLKRLQLELKCKILSIFQIKSPPNTSTLILSATF
jgi:hypothetical protein